MAAPMETAGDHGSGDPNRTAHLMRAVVGRLDEDRAARMFANSADIALLVDAGGIIREVACNDPQLCSSLADGWRGRAWANTVTRDSEEKVSLLMRDAVAPNGTRWREVNHRGAGGGDFPVRYAAVALGRDGSVFAIGRDLREIGRIQERMLDTQRSLDRTSKRLREAETRYRTLFDQASEALLIVDPASGRIVDANPAVGHLAGLPQVRVVGRPVAELFHTTAVAGVQTLLAGVAASGRTDTAAAQLDTGNSPIVVAASRVRCDDDMHLIVRLTPTELRDASPAEQRRTSRILATVDRLPFGFVVTDQALRIVKANPMFLEYIEATREEDARGELLTRWLGRRDRDVDALVANLKRDATAVEVSTVLRTRTGATPVAVTAVGVPGEAAAFGFVVRAVRRVADDQTIQLDGLPRSGEQLSELLGRMSLKDIINEAVVCLERLSIEAALRQTQNNRASAAHLLGLSRQSLYVKLRRYGLAGYPREELVH